MKSEQTRLNKELKRSQAEERNAIWAALTFEAQLESLDNTLGKDQGASKQRMKILDKIRIRNQASVKKK
jgi:hypothetical protein